MRLNEWLEKTGIKPAMLSEWSGVKLDTIYKIMRGGGAQIPTAQKIVAATGGQVDYPDLAPARREKPEDAA